MRVTMATRFSAVVVGLVGLAFASTLAALVSAWYVRDQMRSALRENLPSVRAAEELEIALLEQRGSVSSYLLDNGNRVWLDMLRRQEAEFERRSEEARATAHTQEEHVILDELQHLYRNYSGKREEVIRAFRRGRQASSNRSRFSRHEATVRSSLQRV